MKLTAKNLPSLLSKFFLSTCLVTLSSASITAIAAQESAPERWFEIEVILFKQLNNKKALKEQFPDDVTASALPQYKRSFDLFSPYLQPDLTAIKQFIPLCSSADGESKFSLSQPELTLALPEQALFIQQANEFVYQPMQLSAPVENEESTLTAKDEAAAIDTTQVLTSPGETLAETNTQAETERVESELAETDIEQESEKTAEIVFDWQSHNLDSPLFSNDNVCVYTQEDFQQILSQEQLAKFTLNGFAIEKLPTRLNAAGAHINNSPYLIADDSLLLSDIRKRLHWSKEFRPLLHFGWRQVGVTRKKAIPLKLFAGHHVENDYQQALNDYQIAYAEAQQQEQALIEALQATEAENNENNLAIDTMPFDKDVNTGLIDENQQAERDYYAQVKQQKLTQLFAEINDESLAQNTQTIIDDTLLAIEQQNLDDLLNSTDEFVPEDEHPLDLKNPPEAPLQPWFLDGFFKVHLDHYLYINADFNLLTKGLSNEPLTNDDAEAGKLINFSQNRRVITGEVHYFDHPYIGMVVQIRRFDPSKPKDEAVSQAVR